MERKSNEEVDEDISNSTVKEALAQVNERVKLHQTPALL
jgi:hypothetical protein